MPLQNTRSVNMTQPVSVPRLYVLRALYLVNFALVGSGVVLAYVQRTQPWAPITGVAYAFWAALATTSALGLRYPLAMLPVLLMQFLYKSFWLVAVYLPLQAVGRSTGLVKGMLFGLALDVVAIPWPYVLAQYFRRRGDPWNTRSERHDSSEDHPAA